MKVEKGGNSTFISLTPNDLAAIIAASMDGMQQEKLPYYAYFRENHGHNYYVRINDKAEN